MPERGKYIVIEGNDGTGKSTQAEELAKWLKSEHGIDSYVPHEPAGTPIADAIRTVIKDGSLQRDPWTTVLLFTASRREIWLYAKEQLDRGVWVLSSRNYLSTEAYQGYGDGVPLEKIRSLTRQFTDETYMTPDCTLILSIADDTVRTQRIGDRGDLRTLDAFESRDESFQDRVNTAYLKIAKEYGLPVIDAAQTVEAIARQIQTEVKPLIYAKGKL